MREPRRLLGEHEHVPAGIDPARPNAARMYDYWLGGKDYYAADQEAAEKVLEIAPEARFMARHNREFVGRAVHHLVAEAGIRQIVDIGAGLPTQRNVHEVAQEVAPDATVVYVDYDPVVISHARALLRGGKGVHVLQADLRRVGELLSGRLREYVDLSRPVAFMVTAIFHFITDEERPREIVAALREAMAPGSHLALSHSCIESGPDAAEKIAKIYKNASAPAVLRTRAEILSLFDGFELVEPGLVYTSQWRRDVPETEPDPRKAWMLAGVGRKAG